MSETAKQRTNTRQANIQLYKATGMVAAVLTVLFALYVLPSLALPEVFGHGLQHVLIFGSGVGVGALGLTRPNRKDS